MAAALNPVDPTEAWRLSWHAGWVTSVTFLSPIRLAAGNQDGKILVWDLQDEPFAAGDEKSDKPADTPADLDPVLLLEGHSNCITGLAASADGRWMASSSYDHTIRIWDLQATSTKSEQVKLHKKRRNSDPEPPLVEVRSITHSQELTFHQEWINTLSASSDQSRILTGDDLGLAVLSEMPSGRELNRLQVESPLTSVALSADASSALLCEYFQGEGSYGNKDSFRGAIRVWNLAASQISHDLTAELPSGDRIRPVPKIAAAAFSADSKYLALGRAGFMGGNATIYLVDLATGKKLRDIEGHLNGIRKVGFSADGKYLLSAGFDTTVRIWNVADGKEVAMLGKPRGGQVKDQMVDYALAPDATLAAGADMAGMVHVWKFEA